MILAVALSAAALAAAGPARAETKCRHGVCVNVEDIGNPKYLHFYLSATLYYPTHWNLMYDGRQSELASVAGTQRSVRTYIEAEPGSSHTVSVQYCERQPPSASICSAWIQLTLVKPADAALSSRCNRYADEAVAQAKRNQQMKCGLQKDNPERWTLDQKAHFDWCVSWSGAATEPAREGTYRVVGLKECADKQAAMKQKGQLSPGPKIGEILKETNPVTPAKPLSFAGIWDSKTDEGVAYTLTLDTQGKGSVGAVNPKLDGTAQGSFSSEGKRWNFVMTQPKAGIVSRGEILLSADGNSFDGGITKDTEGTQHSWTGTRRP